MEYSFKDTVALQINACNVLQDNDFKTFPSCKSFSTMIVMLPFKCKGILGFEGSKRLWYVCGRANILSSCYLVAHCENMNPFDLMASQLMLENKPKFLSFLLSAS